MLALKLQRIGKKNHALYRLVVGEKRSKLNGRQTEDLGWYNPHTKQANFKADRVAHWLSTGAEPTETVRVLLRKNNIVV